MSFFDRFETYKNTGEVGRFDHYVPQFLLNNWAINGGPDNKKIWYWSKIDNKIDTETVRKVAGEIDWDVSKSKGVPSDFINKKIFAELLEQKAFGVIKQVNLNTIPNLTVLEESTLATFIGHQITRVPAFRTSLKRYFSIGLSKGLINYEDFGNKEALIEKVVTNKIGLTYDQCINDTPAIRVEDGKPQLLTISLIIGSSIGERMYRGNLHILEIPTDSPDEFVISDNPVIVLDLGDRKTLLGFIPWWEIGEKDFWIFMPISPKKAVWYCKSKRKGGPVENENLDLVQLSNFGQYRHSTDMVFSRNQRILKNHLSMYDSELRKEGVVR
jgi:hypothetical protein